MGQNRCCLSAGRNTRFGNTPTATKAPHRAEFPASAPAIATNLTAPPLDCVSCGRSRNEIHTPHSALRPSVLRPLLRLLLSTLASIGSPIFHLESSRLLSRSECQDLMPDPNLPSRTKQSAECPV